MSHGSVALSVQNMQENGNNYAKFQVKSNGIGLPKKSKKCRITKVNKITFPYLHNVKKQNYTAPI